MGEPLSNEEFHARFDELERKLDVRLERMTSDVAEMVRDAQTEILKAFFPFQEPTGVRMRKLEADETNLNASLTQRMGVLERRLEEIERKLLMDPPAA